MADRDTDITPHGGIAPPVRDLTHNSHLPQLLWKWNHLLLRRNAGPDTPQPLYPAY